MRYQALNLALLFTALSIVAAGPTGNYSRRVAESQSSTYDLQEPDSNENPGRSKGSCHEQCLKEGVQADECESECDWFAVQPPVDNRICRL